eukprot:TRINITY_DN52095_c0_g2_i1.p1 TRINITY_DN52095_c0_g2~~TRINITY_DN52095_c0_g2_i1.p1  ORF type:complete len:157 (-),score=38.31 TRINITY_DN52095_c0_g2_i1:115-585(-)
MTRGPPRSTLSSSSAASDVYKRQVELRRMQTIRLTPTTNYVVHLETSDHLNNSFNKDAGSGPATPATSNLPRQRGFHRAVVASVEKCIKANGDADEWMYEIEQLRESNPYATTNSAFAAILRGEWAVSDVLEMFDGGGGIGAVSYTHLTLPTKRIV